MYAEIQETVKFLSYFLYDKLPRRKVYLFSEQLANFCVLKFHGHWDTEKPLKESDYRSIRVNVHGETESLLSVAANTVGLELEEILQYLPTELTIWINPGEVTYRVGEHGVVSFLYDSSQPKSVSFSKHMEGEGHLKLSMNPPDGTNWVVSSSSGTTSPVFELSSPHDMQFTVGSFAMTRFGSSKQKTNLAALKQIQWKARAAAFGKAQAGILRGIENVSGLPSPSAGSGMVGGLNPAPVHPRNPQGLMLERAGFLPSGSSRPAFAPSWPGCVN